MYDLLLQISLFLSIAAVLYVLVRAVPRISETGERLHPAGKFDRVLGKLPLHQIDGHLNRFFEKTLRRLKVIILRADNTVNMRLNKIKQTNGNGNSSKPYLFEQSEGENGEER
jgi:hypothetical protein